MRDVARLADVSVATVSAVIHQNLPVSAERERRVLEAMEALDYSPNQIARSLKTGRTNVIGMVIPDINNPFFAEIASGVERAAQQRGYSLILCNSNEDHEQEERQVRTLLSRSVDGILIASTAGGGAYESLLKRRPVVFFDRRSPGTIRSMVLTDNVESARKATRHLIDLGHERIAILLGNTEISPHADRFEGFRKAMQEGGLPVRQEYVRTGAHSVEGGLASGLELLKLDVPPTAVFSTNNKMMLGVFRSLNELSLRCPDDLSVVGFDDYFWTQYHSPGVTTVGQPSDLIGQRCVEMLIRKIEPQDDDGRPEGSSEEEQIVLQCELHIRESTAPPKSAAAQRQPFSSDEGRTGTLAGVGEQ